MKTFTKLIIILALMVVGAGVSLAVNDGDAVAHTDEVSQAATTQQTKEEAHYDYVAQVDDTYSAMARKAVQTYGLKNKVNLSKAQIIFAETNLTQAADSPVLLLGQKVAISEADIKQWVDAAKKLTDSQEEAWNYYVPFVDFNTNAVGQSS